MLNFCTRDTLRPASNTDGEQAAHGDNLALPQLDAEGTLNDGSGQDRDVEGIEATAEGNHRIPDSEAARLFRRLRFEGLLGGSTSTETIR